MAGEHGIAAEGDIAQPEPLVLVTHFTWSVERDSAKCPFCNDATVLVCAGAEWGVDEESAIEVFGEGEYEDSLQYGVSISEEITGHYCKACCKLVSLSLNTRH